MKFKGQLKFPDVDHPGIPVALLLDDMHLEVRVDEESVGRWSLIDVEASRLIAAAFEVNLGGEEITFIAEEPLDFAYKGVEHMAETWARVKAHSLPRRGVVIRKSRKDTIPSRLGELRSAVLEEMDESTPAAARHVTPAPGPIEARVSELRDRARPSEVGRDSEEKAPEMPGAPRADEPPKKPVLIPGPGIVTAVGSTSASEKPDSGPQAQAPAVSVVSEAEKPPTEMEPVSEPELKEIPATDVESELASAPESPSEAEVEPQPETAEAQPETEPVVEAVSALDTEPEAVIEPEAAIEPAATEELTEDTLAAVDGAAQSDHEPAAHVEDEAAEEPDRASRADQDSSEIELPQETKELIGTPAGSDEGLFVDLGNYEGEQDDESPPAADEDRAPDGPPDKEPALVGSEVEKSGLLGAVRSAFGRNRVPHEHEFVDAPGGMGLTRQICVECGHISIRSDD